MTNDQVNLHVSKTIENLFKQLLTSMVDADTDEVELKIPIDGDKFEFKVQLISINGEQVVSDAVDELMDVKKAEAR